MEQEPALVKTCSQFLLYDINVTFTDDHKDGKIVAPIYAVASLIKAYTDLYGNERKLELERKIDVWKGRVRELNQEVTLKHGLIGEKVDNVGEDIGLYV